MHMLLRAVIPAETKEEALEKAKPVFEKVVEWGRFDYFATFDEDWAKERWKDVPVAVKFSSKKGQQLINDGLRFTKELFIEALGHIREYIEDKTDEEVFLLDDYGFHYNATLIGEIIGTNTYVYDWDCNSIRTPKDVEELKKFKDQTLWVVCADTHY
jgi:alkanesulfonate monooxygenase SsuD/methylene tetrahydromethanopterin reductase-like flavin-dependent oxidoreductase (luciferase family)